MARTSTKRLRNQRDAHVVVPGASKPRDGYSFTVEATRDQIARRGGEEAVESAAALLTLRCVYEYYTLLQKQSIAHILGEPLAFLADEC